MPTVFFDTNLGGDGSTYNDASFANGGHRVNFLPSLNNVLGVANFTLGRANAAATSATNSANSATAANTAKVAAELALDQFTDQYLGPKSSPPTLDNDGNALLTGAIYFDTTKQALQVYTGTIWIDAAGAQASFKKFVFTATANQVLFSVSPDQYSPNFIQVYLDGVLLDDVDYTATNGTTLTLAQGANVGQKLTILRLDSLDIANVIRAIQATDLTPIDSLVFDDAGNATFNFNLNINGNTTLGNNSTDLHTVLGNVNFNQGVDVLTGAVNIGLNRTQGTANLALHQASTAASVLRLSNTTSGFTAVDGLEIFTDGSNAGFWNRENGNITFRTNNLERFSISNLGDSTFNGNLAYTGTLTGGTGVINIGSGQIYKDAAGLVGIGTATPLGDVHISNATANPKLLITRTGSTGNSQLGFQNTAGSRFIGVFSDRFIIGTGADLSSTGQLELSSSGNAGLGVAPSAWGSSWKAFDVNASAAISSNGTGAAFSNNAYNDSSVWRYKTSTPNIGAQLFLNNPLGNGGFGWFNAPSGTAGNPITFTQAMTLTQAGNLLVGTTSDSGERFRAQTTAGSVAMSAGDGATSDLVVRPSRHASGLLDLSTGSGTVQGITFSTAAGGASLERARITSAGNLLVGTTTDSGYKVAARNICAGILGSSSNENGLTLNPVTAGNNVWNFFTDAGSLRITTGGSTDHLANSEKARIISSGFFKASNTGVYGNVAGIGDSSAAAYHQFQSDQDNTTVAAFNGNTGSNVINYDSVMASGATGFHFSALLNLVRVYQVLANGNVQNTNNSYGAISDGTKKNIIGPAPSYWERYKLIEWVKFVFKNDPNNQEQLGVIAQQVRDVFPGLIEETPDMHEVTKTREVTKTVPVTTTEIQQQSQTTLEEINGKWVETTTVTDVEVQVPVFDEFPIYDSEGNDTGRVHKVQRMQTITETETYTEMEPTGTVTLSVKYSILGHISDVVLQEAMARIEALEAV